MKTLWEIVQGIEHRNHNFPGEPMKCFPNCAHCMIESWAKDRARLWSDKIERAYDTCLPREAHIIDGIVNSIIDELGVPPEELK